MDRDSTPTNERVPSGARAHGSYAVLVALALMATACGIGTPSPDGSARATDSASEAPASTGASASPEASGGGGGSTGMIPQPDVGDLVVAPDDQRVDLAVPTFSDPTAVTNPLFPVSDQHSMLLLGEVGGEPFRAEVTLLPQTRIIAWGGQQVEVLVSQYVAYIGGRLEEVAYDLYAQDDTGAVWYFGEDVYNFADGVIVDTHGTWLAGLDGPAAMIMPADPAVGDVYRPENIPGFVFEEVTIRAVNQQVDGPLGPVDGVILTDELHMDATHEDKTFAPGYGEFFTGGGGDVEALALGIPTDALSEPVPDELVTLHDRALAAYDAAAAEDWDAAGQALDELTPAWETYGGGEVPARIGPIMADALDALGASVEAQDADAARQAALDVAGSALDLQLRYRPPVEVDLGRMTLWAARMAADAEADDFASVNGDFFAIDYIRDRILTSLTDAELADLNFQLEELLSVVGDEDAEAVVEGAQQLRETLEGLEPQA